MNEKFSLFLDNAGNSDFGLYRSVALFPTSHLKGNIVWLPYDFIMDMAQVLTLVERRNFRSDFETKISDRFQMVFDKEAATHFPLIDVWQQYQGQQVSKHYFENKCFPIHLDPKNDFKWMIKKHFKSTEGQIEWTFSMHPLLRFFSDPRFSGLLSKSGFKQATDQLQLSLTA